MQHESKGSVLVLKCKAICGCAFVFSPTFGYNNTTSGGQIVSLLCVYADLCCAHTPNRDAGYEAEHNSKDDYQKFPT